MSTKFDRVVVAGLLLFLGGAAYLLSATIGAALYPGFDMKSNWNSDLQATCGIPPATPQPCVVVQPASAIFTAGLIIIGLTSALAAYLLFQVVKPRRPMVFLLIGGVAIFLDGIFSEEFFALHSIFNDAASVFYILAIIDSYRFVRAPVRWVVLALGILAAVVALDLVANQMISPAADINVLGVGGMERVYAYLIVLWLVLLGGALMVQPGLFSGVSVMARDRQPG